MQTIRISQSPITLPRTLSSVLPPHLCDAVCRCGAPAAEEIRLHSGRVATVTSCNRNYPTGVILRADEMQELLCRMCGGSLYAFSESICRGAISMAEGIRVGVCGSAATENGRIIGVGEVSGLIIRIPHAINADAAPLLQRLRTPNGLCSMLIFAPPGVGKTTLLRALAREAASPAQGIRTVVVDTRRELCFTLDGADLTLDILSGYPRELGIGIAVRSLGAELILCDEIGTAEDARAILAAANCGVPLIASAHAKSCTELLSRPAIQELHNAGIFDLYVGLRRTGARFQYDIYPREEGGRFL